MFGDLVSKIWDRLRERSTWIQIGVLLSVLAMIAPGIISPETPERYDDLTQLIEEHIEEGKEIVELSLEEYRELRAEVEEDIGFLTETGRRVWQMVTQVLTLLLSLFGIGRPDAIRGVEVQHIMKAHGIDPDDPLALEDE